MTAQMSRAVARRGDEASAALGELKSRETYLGYDRAERLVSPGGFIANRATTYRAAPLKLNDWSFEGDWTVGKQSARSGARSHDHLSLPRPPLHWSGLAHASRALHGHTRRQAPRPMGSDMRGRSGP